METRPRGVGVAPRRVLLSNTYEQVLDYKQLVAAYREQRDSLQADWDAWEQAQDYGGHADDASQYGTVRSEASLGTNRQKSGSKCGCT